MVIKVDFTQPRRQRDCGTDWKFPASNMKCAPPVAIQFLILFGEEICATYFTYLQQVS
jgi:hypothetical protein